MTAALDDRLGSLLGETERALRTWLPEQRWFGARGRRVGRVRLRVLTRFADQLAWGGPAGLLTVAEVDVGGEVVRYGLPLGVRAPGTPLPGVVPITSTGELAVYDATADDRLAGELLALIDTGAVRDGVRFVPKRRAGLALVLRHGLAGRLAGAEQSNTSVVLGERYILKLFRRIPDGVNPDLDLHHALDAADTPHIAPLLGSIEGELDGVPVTLAMLQSYCADATDGWDLATADVAALPGSGRARRDFAAEAAVLGRAVASVHTALADRLGTVPLTGTRLTAISGSMLARLTDAAREVPELAGCEDRLRAAFAAVADLPPGGLAQRVHGDLHLGQVLRTPTRWLLIDFEGEPSAALPERLARQSPLRDVAGMLRSIDYAAHHRRTGPGPDPGVAAEWAARTRDAFCTGYGRQAGADPRAQAVLLQAYELDKTVYEARYEARHRPDWLPIPLRALRQLLGGTR